MRDLFEGTRKWLLEKLPGLIKRRWTGLSPLLIALLVAVVFVFWKDPAIRVADGSGRLLVRVPDTFQTLSIELSNNLFITDVALCFTPIPSGPEQPITKTNFGRSTTTIEVMNELARQSPTAEKSGTVDIEVLHSTALPIELIRVELDTIEQDLKAFINKGIRNRNKQLIRWNQSTHIVAQLLLVANDVISSVIVATMALYAIWLFMHTLYLLVDRAKDSKLFRIKWVANLLSIDAHTIDSQTLKVYTTSYRIRSEYYKFIQVLGPALGFVLTVSSLVVAFSPQIRTAQSIAQYFESLHIALVSTFLGLLLRLLAAWCQRISFMTCLKVAAHVSPGPSSETVGSHSHDSRA